MFDRRQSPRTSQRLLWMLGGAALGAGVMYLADPQRGQARRAALEEHGAELARGVGSWSPSSDPAVQGAADELTPDLKDPSDAVLVERVRSDAVGPSRVRNSAIVTTVEGGVVTVRGQVDEPTDRDDLLTRIRDVDGVEEIVDLTHLPDEPAPTRS